jgi:hypothetical protein
MLLIFTVITCLILSACSPRPMQPFAPGTHPFLILKETEFAELQALATQSPWREMKATAISDATHLVYEPTEGYKKKSGRLGQIVNANALSFILDPVNRNIYKRKILQAIDYWDDLFPSLYKGGADDWTHAVPPGEALFNCILALDVIHNSLTASELSAAESKLGQVSDWYWTHDSPHLTVWCVRGLWSLYSGEARFATARDEYRRSLFNHITPDGVYPPGPGYAAARVNNPATQHFLDILEFTGNGTFRSDPKLKNFHEWLFGYSLTPFKRSFIFGDTAPVKFSARSSPASYSASRYSDLAARYAAGNVEGKAQNLLLFYILMRKPMPKPERAGSRIFTDGGAWFQENDTSPNALAGVLWNARTIGDNHAHKEVNSLNLCGYGEYLLRNAGYTGWHEGALGFPWDYINKRAVSGNTVLVDYSFADNFNPPLTNDHVSKAGAGISEGFVSPGFDYANGDSGSALPNGKHYRTLVFVHPQDNRNGYWVVFDEVEVKKAGDTVHVALHPSSAVYSVVSPSEEYQWTINKYSGHDVFLTIFQGTPPRSSEVKDGLLAGLGNFIGKYLYSTYDTNRVVRRNIVTVFFPHDATHQKANMTRIEGMGYTGGGISLGDNVTDVALESSSPDTVTYNNVSFKASASLFRLQGGSVAFYFVRHGRLFGGAMSTRNGFISDKEVSLYVKGSDGKIISPGTAITFYHPGITSVLLDNEAAPLLDKGRGWVKTTVGPGSYDLKFVTNTR